MNANELAEIQAFKTEELTMWERNHTATMLRKQQEEIEYWKDKFNKAMKIQEIKPAKYSDEWWKEVKEFNKKAQEIYV